MRKLIIGFFSILLIVACGNKKEETAPVEVKPANVAVGVGKITPQGGVSNLASPVAGIVSEINVTTGTKVKSGDLLLSIDNTDASLALSEINSRLSTQQKSIQSAKLMKEQGSTRMRDLERKLNDARELLAAGAVTGESVRNLQNDYDLEKQHQEKLQNDIALQESQLREIASQKSVRTEDLNRTSLRAPMDGIVLDVLPKKGEAVNRYETYVVLAPDAPLIVQAEIDEMFSNRLALGQLCEIHVAGSDQPVAQGKIIGISPDLKKKSLFSDSGQDFQDRRVREIEVSINNDANLLIDTKVECVVQLN
ncbi:MAG: HlyD family efflux transporter periplasmic adaptor subunit [Bacteroidia bacterium]|nr:HlyD family efflux transporter periplasmic adaptor subunit [Bacteroidia bacterium]